MAKLHHRRRLSSAARRRTGRRFRSGTDPRVPRFEPLEQRLVLSLSPNLLDFDTAANVLQQVDITGATIVVHGFQFPETLPMLGGSGQSLQPLAEEIRNFANDRADEHGWLLVHRTDDLTGAPIEGQLGFFQADGGLLSASGADGAKERGELVLLFDWFPGSHKLSPGWMESAGDALFNVLVGLDIVDLSTPVPSAPPLHFIAHSFGTVVASEAVERLAAYDVQLDDLHVTYLDPHDFSEGLWFDTAQRGWTLGQPPEYGATVWGNVTFADVYYQTTASSVIDTFDGPKPFPFIPDGRPIPGAYNRYVPNDVFVTANPHSEIWETLYFQTVTPGQSNYLEATEGFAFSRLGNGFGLRETAPKVFFNEGAPSPELWQDHKHSPEYLVDRTTGLDVQDSLAALGFFDLPGDTATKQFQNHKWEPIWTPWLIYNGDFELPGDGWNVPGWSFHGGGGNAPVGITGLGTNQSLEFLDTYGYAQRSSNALIVPQQAAGIALDAMVLPIRPQGPGGHVLRILLGDTLLERVDIDELVVAVEKTWTPVIAAVPESLRGRPLPLIIELISDVPAQHLPTLAVCVDNIRFLHGGKTADVIPVDLMRYSTWQSGFELVGLELVGNPEQPPVPLQVSKNDRRGDLELSLDSLSAGTVIFSDRIATTAGNFRDTGQFYFAPGTDDGLAHDQDPDSPGFQGTVRGWYKKGERLFEITSADIALTEPIEHLSHGNLHANLRFWLGQKLPDSIFAASSFEAWYEQEWDLVRISEFAIEGVPGRTWILEDRQNHRDYAIVEWQPWPGQPRSLLVFEADFVEILIESGHSVTGHTAVDQGISTLDAMRRQQRLRYLGFPDEDGEPLAVDGIIGPKSMYATGRFNAAVSGESEVSSSMYLTDAGLRFINANNAPRWEPLIPGDVAEGHAMSVSSGEPWNESAGGGLLATSWQNPENHLDVNADGRVEPLDAWLIIDEINRNGSRALPSRTGEYLQRPHFDVNGDGYVTPLDALLVVHDIGFRSSQPEAARWEELSPAEIAAGHAMSAASGEPWDELTDGGLLATSWQNPDNHFDVNGNGVVEPLDVLLIVNEINRNGSRALPPRTADFLHVPYYDVNGDGYVTPLDALLVIHDIGLRSSQADAPRGLSDAESAPKSVGDDQGAGSAVAVDAERPVSLQAQHSGDADSLLQPAQSAWQSGDNSIFDVRGELYGTNWLNETIHRGARAARDSGVTAGIEVISISPSGMQADFEVDSGAPQSELVQLIRAFAVNPAPWTWVSRVAVKDPAVADELNRMLGGGIVVHVADLGCSFRLELAPPLPVFWDVAFQDTFDRSAVLAGVGELADWLGTVTTTEEFQRPIPGIGHGEYVGYTELADEPEAVGVSLADVLDVHGILEQALIWPLMGNDQWYPTDVAEALSRTSGGDVVFTVTASDATADEADEAAVRAKIQGNTFRAVTWQLGMGQDLHVELGAHASVDLEVGFVIDVTLGHRGTGAAEALDTFFLRVHEVSVTAAAESNDLDATARYGVLGLDVQAGRVETDVQVAVDVMGGRRFGLEDLKGFESGLGGDGAAASWGSVTATRNHEGHLPVTAMLAGENINQASTTPAFLIAFQDDQEDAWSVQPNEDLHNQFQPFVALTPEGLVGGLRQYAEWLLAGQPDALEQPVPLAQNLGLSETLNFGEALTEAIVAPLSQLRLRALQPPQTFVLSHDAAFFLTINGSETVPVTLSREATAGNNTLAHLVDDFQAALDAALTGTSLPGACRVVASDGRLMITADARSVQSLRLVHASEVDEDLDGRGAAALGFAPVEEVDGLSFRTVQGFLAQLAETLGVSEQDEITVNWDLASRELRFHVPQFGHVWEPLPFSLGLDAHLGSLINIHATGDVVVSAEAVGEVAFGFLLAPLGSEFALHATTPLDAVPALHALYNGRGVEIGPGPHLAITLRDGSEFLVDLSLVPDEPTIGDVIGLIEDASRTEPSADARIQVQLDSHALTLVDESVDSPEEAQTDFIVAVPGAGTANQLGFVGQSQEGRIRGKVLADELNDATPLASVNRGAGITLTGGPHLIITVRNGESFSVDLGGLGADATIGHLRAHIEQSSIAEPGSEPRVTVELASRWLELVDQTQGADGEDATFSVAAPDPRLAFGLGLLQRDEGADGRIEGKALHGQTLADRVFLWAPDGDKPGKFASFTGHIGVLARDIDATARFGFVDVDVDGGEGSAHAHAQLVLRDPEQRDQVYVSELVDWLRTAGLANGDQAGDANGDELPSPLWGQASASARVRLPLQVAGEVPGLELSPSAEIVAVWPQFYADSDDLRFAYQDLDPLRQLEYIAMLGMDRSTPLAALNQGLGVHRGTLVFALSDGESHYEVSLHGARTVGHFLDRVRQVTRGDVVAAISADGDRFILTDATDGNGAFSISAKDGSPVADDLGIAGIGDDEGILEGEVVWSPGILAALGQVAALVEDLQRHNPVLDVALPGINRPLREMLNFRETFDDWLEQLRAEPAESIQKLEAALNEVLSESFTVRVDDDVLRMDVSLGATFPAE